VVEAAPTQAPKQKVQIPWKLIIYLVIAAIGVQIIAVFWKTVASPAIDAITKFMGGVTGAYTAAASNPWLFLIAGALAIFVPAGNKYFADKAKDVIKDKDLSPKEKEAVIKEGIKIEKKRASEKATTEQERQAAERALPEATREAEEATEAADKEKPENKEAREREIEKFEHPVE
jgi:hypothetical protein